MKNWKIKKLKKRKILFIYNIMFVDVNVVIIKFDIFDIELRMEIFLLLR